MSAKRHKQSVFFLFFSLGLLLVSPLLAEQVRVILKNGSVASGELLSKSSQTVKIRKGNGQIVTIPRSKIKRLETGKQKVAILDFLSQSAGKLGWEVSENLRTLITQARRLKVIERSQINKVLKEQALQLSGFIDEKSAVKVGKILGVRYLIMGSVTKIGSVYTINIRIVDVETAEVTEAEQIRTKSEDGIPKALENLAKQIGTHGMVDHGSLSSKEGMVLVPAGEFLMGSNYNDTDDSEKPSHKVYLDSFYIDKYEVTNAQYKECVEAGACSAPHDTIAFNSSQYVKHPVVYVDWYQAKAYCEWKGKRLPTEAEWEKAARGTDGRRYPWGNRWCEACANWGEGGKKDGYDGTAPVGSFPNGKSPYGIYDMAGNVWEWVSDWYDKHYYSKSPTKNPKGPSSGTDKVMRGGSWRFYIIKDFRATARNRYSPGNWYRGRGFRCAQ